MAELTSKAVVSYLGPYSSMASVTLMITRHLKRELEKRDGVE
jgi:hypothetical protein